MTDYFRKEIPFKFSVLKEIYKDNRYILEDIGCNNFFKEKVIEIILFKIRNIVKNNFSYKDYNIFFKYYFQNWNQELIAKFYNITQPAVSKKLSKILNEVEREIKKWDFLLWE